MQIFGSTYHDVSKKSSPLRTLLKFLFSIAIVFTVSSHNLSRRPGRVFWVNFCKKCGNCGEKKTRRISAHFLQKFTPKNSAFLTKINCETSTRERLRFSELPKYFMFFSEINFALN